MSARAIAKDKTQRGANSSSSLQRICSAGPQVAQRGGFFGRCGHSSPGPRWFFVCSGVSVTKNSSQTRLEEPEPPPRGIPAGLSGEMEPLSRGPRCARGEAGDRNNPRGMSSSLCPRNGTVPWGKGGNRAPTEASPCPHPDSNRPPDPPQNLEL